MNPADYGMLWMSQFAPERMVLDDNSMMAVGMSVMEDITHQTHSMVKKIFFCCFFFMSVNMPKLS